MKLSIPLGAYMRYRKSGRYLYGVKQKTITWTTKEPPKGSTVYAVTWTEFQHPLMASATYIQP